MNRNLLTILLVFFTFGLYAQVVLQENFESTPLSVTSSSTGTGVWALNTRIQSQGLQSDSCVVTTGDITYLTSNSFSTIGKYSVILEFDQICKVDYFDSAFVQYSIDNGVTFQNINAAYYLGTSGYGTLGNRFAVTSDTAWHAQDTTEVTNTMWKNEIFDISAIASNQANVLIRFRLVDGGLFGPDGNQNFPGWFIDSLKVTATFSEMVPPTMSMLAPIIQDTAYSAGPYNVGAYIFDLSGIDTAICIYNVMPGNIYDTIAMVLDPNYTDSFYCDIPFYGFGRTISYYVKAVDGSYAHNEDSLSTYSFFCKNATGGDFIIGDGSTSLASTVGNPFGQFWTGNKNQFLILASELNALSAAGGNISSIAFDVTTTNSATSSGSNHDGFTVKIKSTSTSALTTTFETGLTQVYTASSYQTVLGWNTFTFTTPFAWDGVSNIIIETCFDNGASNYSGSAGINVNTTTFNSVTNTYSDAATNECAETSGTISSTRPDMKIVIMSASTLNNDIGINNITSPSLGSTAGTLTPVEVTLKNFGADTVTTASIDWVYDGVTQTAASYNGNLFPDSTSSSINLGNITPTAGAHRITAWSSMPNGVFDNDIANDTSNFDFYACSGALSGTYTIGGTSPDFASFYYASLALNQCGISGPVIFNVATGTYNEHFELMSIVGSSATNTVTFQSVSGDSTDVILAFDATGTVDNYVVKLNGASFISFKNMTIEAQDVNYARVFVMSDSVHDLSLNNNIIKTTLSDTLYDSRMALLYALDSTIGNNINITDNALTNGSYAIFLRGDTVDASNWLINNNTIVGHSSIGIELVNGVSVEVNGNTIEADTLSTFAGYEGVYLLGCKTTANIKKNIVSAEMTGFGYGIRFTSCEFDSLTPANLVNNLVTIHGDAAGTSLSSCILIHETKNVNIYYNNVKHTGSMANSCAMLLFSGTEGKVREIDIVNNNLTNSAGGYIYYVQNATDSIWTNHHNNLFSFGTSSTIAKLNGTDISTLSDWITATSATNLISENPYFLSPTDLHVVNNILNGMGIPITGITEDIDGDIRNTTTPDIGADEFDPSPWDVAAIDLLSPLGACGLGTSEVVSMRIKNIGDSTINGNLTLSYSWPGGTVVTENITATITPGDTLTYVFTATADLDINYYGKDSIFEFSGWANLLNDPIPYNDTAYLEVVSSYMPNAPITTPATANYGSSIIITATSNDSLYWYATDTSSQEIAATNNFNTGLLYDTTTFYVEAHSGGSILKITETVQFKTGGGYTNPYPSYFPTGDFDGVEITNLGSGPAKLDGYTINVSVGPTMYTYTFPVGTTVPSGGVVVALYQSGLAIGPAGNNVFYISSSTSISSSSAVAYWLTDAYGVVADAFASYGAPFPAGSGVVASDFTGANPSGSGKAGSVRIFSDSDDAADWSFTDQVAASFGSLNPQLSVGGGGNACASPRVPLQVNVVGFPSIDAGISTIVNPSGTILSGTSQIVQAEISNYGMNTLTTVDVIWMRTGFTQPDTFHYSGNIAYSNVDTVNLDTTIFSPGLKNIIAWTYNPNGISDTINSNDTSYIAFNACLHGTYTIGASATADFATFGDAVAALQNAGICGDVVFNVDTGTYNEQLVIDEIIGTDANNTVTFQSITGDSTDVVLQYASTGSASNYVLKLNGADYFTFQNMTIKAFGIGNYTGVIEIGNGSNHNSFKNNIIETGVSTSSYARCIYSNTGDDNYTTIVNNHLKNGYYAIYLRGVSSSNLEVGNIIENNIIEDFYYYGIYGYNQDSLQVKNNIITDGSNSNYGYAIYFYYCDNEMRIIGNTLNLHPNSYKYGIRTYFCDGTASQRGLIANNMISITNGTGTNYGMYIYNSTFLDVYYNSVNITAGSTTSRAAHIYASLATADVNIVNNIFRDSVGYTVYIQSATGISTMDNNSYYSDGPNFAYMGADLADLAALQTASSMDANSVTVNPVFFADTNLRLFSTQLSGLGAPLSVITTDIDGEQRSAYAPTIGADEVPLLPIDIGLESIVNLPTTTTEFQMVTVDVDVKNYGLDTIYAFDVEYLVNNANAVTYSYNGMIVPGGIETITLAAFSAPAGNATFCVKTVLATDSNAYNDSKCKPFFSAPMKDADMLMVHEIEPYCGITYETIKVRIANIGVDTINASNQTTPPTVYYTINNGSVVSEPFTTVVAPDDTVDYSFATLAYLGTNNFVDSTYVINSWIKFPNDNNAVNDSAETSLEVIHVPQPPTVISPVATPYGTQTTLTASSPDSMFWHKDDTSSLILGEGSSYYTPYLYADDTFRVNSVSGGTGGDQIIGTDNVVNMHLPLEMYYGYTYSQSIFTPADFNGVFGNITTVAYYYNGNSSITGDDIQIYMGTTNNNSFTSNTDWLDYSDLTLVYTGTLNTTTTAGWITYTLITPFNYDGSSNLVIAFDENTPGYHSSSDEFYCTQVGAGRSIYYYSDGTNPDPMNPIQGILSAYIPNTKLEVIPSGCPSTRVPVAVNVGAQSNTDAGVISLESPVSGVYMSATEDVTVKVKNFGLNSQTNIPVNYSINGGVVVNDIIPGPIASGDTATFTFSQTADLSNMGNNFHFKTYTSLTGDATALNDTLNENVMSEYPIYCISKAMSATYSDLTNVSVGSVFNNSSAATGNMYTDFMQTVNPAFVQIGVPSMVSITSAIPPGYSYTETGFDKIYIDYNRDGDFEDVNEEVFSAASTNSGTVLGSFTVPAGVVPGITAMRVVHAIGYSISAPSDVTPCGTYNYGETEDYLVNITERIPNDLGVEAILSPVTISNSQSPNLKVRLRNFGLNTASTFNVKYTINNGAPINYVYSGAPIAPFDSMDVNIGSINVAQGTSVIKVYTELAGDSVNVNDTATTETFVTAYAALSYFDDFDGNNLWFNDTLQNQWELGKPTATNIDSAHSGNNVWAINLDGNYANNSDDRLYSPIFIFPSIVDSAVLSFWQYIDCGSSDGGYLQFKDGVNSNWLSVGYVSDAAGTNWFNNINGGTSKWSYENSGWVKSEYKINFTSIMNSFYMKGDTIQFRYVFYSNSSNNSRDGWAIDDFKIELPGIPDDVGVVAITSPSQSVQTGSNIDVTIEVKNYGSNLITSIPVSYTVNGNTPIAATFTPSGGGLMPDSTETYTFATTFMAPSNGFNICAKTSLSGDQYPQNNEVCKNVISTPASIDVGVVSVDVSPKDGDTTYMSNNTLVTVKVVNFGLDTQTSIPLSYVYAGVTGGTETWTGSIAQGDTATFTFTSSYTSPVGNYQLCVTSSLSGDAEVSNDEMCHGYVGMLVGIEDANGIQFTVSQNEPNPAFGKVSIDYVLPKSGKVHFELRNSLGQVITSTEETHNSGNNTMVVDASVLSNGVYYYTFEFDGKRITRKMVVSE